MRNESFEIRKWQQFDRLLQRMRFGKAIPLIPDGSELCDLGCGKTGDFLVFIEGRISRGVGLDCDVASLKNERISLLKCDLNGKFPLDENCFDCVTSLAVLEHLENPNLFLDEAFRILKRGGFLILTTPDPSLRPILEFLGFMKIINREEIRDHKHYFSKKELEETLGKTGFEQVEVAGFQFGFNNMVVAKK